MTSLPTFLFYILTVTGQFKYPLVFLATLIEGPLLMIACGFLLHLHIFSLALLLLILILGDLTADIIWYYIGRFLLEPFLKKHGHFLSITPERLAQAKELFRRYHVKILFISKITVGFGLALAMLMAAGAMRIPFRTYFIINLIGEIILVVVLLTIGYFFGALYNLIADSFKISSLIVGAVIFLAFAFGFSRYLKNKIINL